MKAFLLPLPLFFMTFALAQTDTIGPVITLLGNNPDTVEVYTPYLEAGYTAYDGVDGNLTDSVVVLGNVDTTVLGSYMLIYTVSDSAGNMASVDREVWVLDQTAPEIELKGDSTVLVLRFSQLIDSGVAVADNYDQNPQILIGGNFQSTLLNDTLQRTYQAVDQSGNKSNIIVRTIIVWSDPGGITTIPAPAVRIYQVPGTNMLRIWGYTQSARTSINIYDMQGKMRLKQPMEASETTLALNLQSAVYLIKIQNKDEMYTQKFFWEAK